jgi:hypothetical protein
MFNLREHGRRRVVVSPDHIELLSFIETRSGFEQGLANFADAYDLLVLGNSIDDEISLFVQCVTSVCAREDISQKQGLRIYWKHATQPFGGSISAILKPNRRYD